MQPPSGILALVAGQTVGADGFLANMGSEDFLSCLSRPALEASCKDTPVLPRQRVKDTRAALVEHFADGHFVHPSALFAPDVLALGDWLTSNAAIDEEEDAVSTADPEEFGGGAPVDPSHSEAEAANEDYVDGS